MPEYFWKKKVKYARLWIICWSIVFSILLFSINSHAISLPFYMLFITIPLQILGPLIVLNKIVSKLDEKCNREILTWAKKSYGL